MVVMVVVKSDQDYESAPGRSCRLIFFWFFFWGGTLVRTYHHERGACVNCVRVDGLAVVVVLRERD